MKYRRTNIFEMELLLISSMVVDDWMRRVTSTALRKCDLFNFFHSKASIFIVSCDCAIAVYYVAEHRFILEVSVTQHRSPHIILQFYSLEIKGFLWQKVCSIRFYYYFSKIFLVKSRRICSLICILDI